MAVHAAVSALLTCAADIYHPTTSTGDLGDKTRGYPGSADVSDQACLIRPFDTRNRGQGLIPQEWGIGYEECKWGVFSEDVALQEGDKIVQKKWSDETALSSAEQARNTLIVRSILDARAYIGCWQALLTTHGRRT